MLVSLTSTTPDATDLGYLLHKHPDRVRSVDVGFGRAHVFYPEATAQRCTATTYVEVDPFGPARHRRERRAQGLEPYLNDRPYAASSMLSVALGRLFRTAMSGTCKDRPELVAQPLDLEIDLPVVPVRGGQEMLRRLFGPLGYEVAGAPIALDPEFPQWGDSRYVSARLAGRQTVRAALEHLYVLLPVLDDAKHYWIGPDEVDKLLRRGGDWLGSHPESDLIARRYLRLPGYTREALARLADTGEDTDLLDAQRDAAEQATERPIRLGEQRLDAVLEAVRSVGAGRVVDLGCGEGRLLQRLIAEPAVTRAVGVDASVGALERAEKRLGLDGMSERRRERIELLQGALTYSDSRLRGFDVATVTEVVEHVDPERIDVFVEAVFGLISAASVVLTTPNREYNANFERLDARGLRHDDHRFEWTRSEFESWARGVCERFGYSVEISAVGPVDPVHGPPTPDGGVPPAVRRRIDRIEVPEVGLVVLCGASGSGKSTFARRHFAPTEIVSSDQCRALVGDDETDQSVTAAAFELLHAIVEKRLEIGRLTVVDATNARPDDRKPVVELARRWDVLATAIVFDLSLAVCLEHNRQRSDRRTPPHAVKRQHDTLRRGAKRLRKERFTRVYTLGSTEELDSVEVARTRLWSDRRDDHGPFDIVGDVHGCHSELLSLLDRLGYDTAADPIAHPEGRRAVFLGDLADRGPGVAEVLDVAMSMVASGSALCVAGNHEVKLRRALAGRNVKLSHGLSESLEQLQRRAPEFSERVAEFIRQPHQPTTCSTAGVWWSPTPAFPSGTTGARRAGCGTSPSTATPTARPTSSGLPGAVPVGRGLPRRRSRRLRPHAGAHGRHGSTTPSAWTPARSTAAS